MRGKDFGVPQPEGHLPAQEILRVAQGKLRIVLGLVGKAVIDRNHRLRVPMVLLEEEAIDHPFEDLGFAHAPPAQQHGGHGSALPGVQGRPVEVIQEFLAVRVDLFGDQGPDGPVGDAWFFYHGDHLSSLRAAALAWGMRRTRFWRIPGVSCPWIFRQYSGNFVHIGLPVQCKVVPRHDMVLDIPRETPPGEFDGLIIGEIIAESERFRRRKE